METNANTHGKCVKCGRAIELEMLLPGCLVTRADTKKRIYAGYDVDFDVCPACVKNRMRKDAAFYAALLVLSVCAAVFFGITVVLMIEDILASLSGGDVEEALILPLLTVTAVCGVICFFLELDKVVNEARAGGKIAIIKYRIARKLFIFKDKNELNHAYGSGKKLFKRFSAKKASVITQRVYQNGAWSAEGFRQENEE